MYPFASPMMMGQAAGGGAAFTWDPAAKSSEIALSNGNTLATKTTASSYAYARGLTPRGGGKYYAEGKLVSAGANRIASFGVATASASLNDPINGTNQGRLYFASGAVVGGPSGTGSLPPLVVGDIMGVAVDFAANTTAFYKNGTLVNTQSWGAGQTLFPFFGGFDQNDAYLAVAPSFLPSGFSPWG